MKLFRSVLFTAVLMSAALISAVSAAAQQHQVAGHTTASPYEGQQNRSIKALPEDRVAGLLQGKGLGYAKAAELNGYPGPVHVLELADALKLSQQQRESTEVLKQKAVAKFQQLGAKLVAAEQALDEAFAEKNINSASLDKLVLAAAQVEAKLRAEHLRTHLLQTELLSRHQIHQYMMLRGYMGGDTSHSGSHGHH